MVEKSNIFHFNMPYKLWTSEEENLLRELISTKKYSYNQMSKFFEGRGGESLRHHAINMGINQKGRIHFTHSYNKNFFSTPNPINCYVAGYWAADGHIADNPTTRVVAIELSHTEWHQLEKFKTLMKYTGDVRDSSYPGREKMCALRFYSAYQLAEDLEKNFGVTKQKTYRLSPPNLNNDHLKLSYLAGLLDGDGCVNISITNRLCISYTSSSIKIMEWVKTFIESLDLQRLSDKGGIIRRVSGGWNAYVFQVCGLKAIDLIRRIQKLKSEGIPILDRKWDNEKLNTYITNFEREHNLLPSS